jgi:hypothetical protein
MASLHPIANAAAAAIRITASRRRRAPLTIPLTIMTIDVRAGRPPACLLQRWTEVTYRRTIVLGLSALLVALPSPAAAGKEHGSHDSSILTTAEFDELFRQELADLKPLSRGVPAQPASAAEASAYRYDRAGFEAAARRVDELAKAKAADSYGGAALSPVDPVLYLGFTKSPESVKSLLNMTAFRYEYRLVQTPTTQAEREAAVEALRSAGLDSLTYKSLDDAIDVAVPPNQAAALADEVENVVAAFAGRDRAAEIYAALRATTGTNQTHNAGAIRVVVEERRVVPESLSAGVANFTASGNPWCTFGANMVEISTGTRFAVTARHCVDGGDVFRNGHRFTVRERSLAGDEDWAILNIPAGIAPGLGQVWVSASWQINIHGPWRSWMTGEARTKMGRVSGYTEGVELGVDCGFPTATYWSMGGDSGSPVLYPYGTPRIRGVHFGRCGSNAAFTAIFDVELGNGTATQYRVLTYNE